MLFAEQMQEAIEYLSEEGTVVKMLQNINTENKIAWLKAVRTKYDLGLKDAKELVDMMVERPRSHSQNQMVEKLREGIRNGEHRRNIVKQYGSDSEPNYFCEPTELPSPRTWLMHYSNIDFLLGALEGVDPIARDQIISDLLRAKECGFTHVRIETQVNK